jgi:hypothetical protein
MTERTTQRGDDELAVCHVCGQRFATQADLLEHLEHMHEGEQLADANEERPGA